MTNDPLIPFLDGLAKYRFNGPVANASNARHFDVEDAHVMEESPRRYSLVCHETRTRTVVGGEGVNEADMISAIASEGSMEAFCAFLMHNQRRALYLHSEHSAEPSGYADYYEFSAWSQEPPPA